MNDLNTPYIWVAAVARLFADSTDNSPLIGMSFDQGVLWDELTEAISVLEDMESAA